MQLQRNALSGLDSTLIAVASTAPANGFATNTVALVAAVGLSGPGALLFGAVPMFGIALAYFYLNAWRSDAGAAYSWVGRTLNPTLGFLAGWSLLVAIVLFMVVGSFPVASATLHFIAPTVETNIIAVTAVGLVWFLIVVVIVLLGIKTTANVQRAVTIFQIGALLFFAAGALTKGVAHPVNPPQWSWFQPMGGDGWHSFIAGAVVAIFYFWGWDISSNLTEETVDRATTPGLAGIAGMLIILALFLMSQLAAQLIMTPGAIADASSNLLVAYASAAVPPSWTSIAVPVAALVIVVGTIGVLEASLVQGGRTMFSMARDRVLDERLARLNTRFLTPWNATWVLSIVTVALFLLAATSSSVNDVLKNSISAIGLLVAFYYGLSGFACAKYYRHANRRDRVLLVFRTIYPVIASLFLLAVVAYQLSLAGWRADAEVIGMLAVGVIPMIYYRRLYRSSYYDEPLVQASSG